MSRQARSPWKTTQGILERAKYGDDGSFRFDLVVETNHSRHLAEELRLMNAPNLPIGPIKRPPQHFQRAGSCEATLAASLGVNLSRNSLEHSKDQAFGSVLITVH
jgi:hypothetical protein